MGQSPIKARNLIVAGVVAMMLIVLTLTACVVTTDPISPLPTPVSPVRTPTPGLPVRPTPGLPIRPTVPPRSTTIEVTEADDLCDQASVLWDHPAVEQGWVKIHDVVGKGIWRGYLDLELRLDGEVIAQRTVELQNAPPPDGPGTGLFETAEWCWDEEDVVPGTLEQWIRLRWSAPGQDDVFGIGVVDDQVAKPDERGFTQQHEFVIPFRTYLPVVKND